MRTLLVEDDADLTEAIEAAARSWTIQTIINGKQQAALRIRDLVAVSTLSAGLLALRSTKFDLVITDVALGADSGVKLVEFVRSLEPAPLVVAISGAARAAQAFTLAGLGVRGYLAKPFDLHDLRGTIEGVLSRPPDVAAYAMAQVGHRPIHAVQDEVKRAMLLRALQLESWNISRAATRLGVTRAAVQQMIDRYELPRNRQRSTVDLTK